MKFILAQIRIDGICYHVKVLDRSSWWPQSEMSNVPADARVFDSSVEADCVEAVRLMLDHDYKPLIVKNP